MKALETHQVDVWYRGLLSLLVRFVNGRLVPVLLGKGIGSSER